MNINKLLKPKTIALIGASETSSFGGACAKNLLNGEYNNKNIYFVSLKNKYVFGKKCFNSILDIPTDIDLLIIATNKNTVISILYNAKIKKVKAAVIYASGFIETHTKESIELENKLIETANKLNIQIMGPNCAGYTNFINGINCFAFLSEKRNRKGNFGFISQSGQIALSLIDNQNTKLSYCISCGNSNIITLSDYFMFLLNDKNTKCIGLYIESIKNIKAFEECLKIALLKNKKIIILKMGKSKNTLNIIKNHTGYNSTINDKTLNILIKKYNAIKVNDIEEMIYASSILTNTSFIPSKNKNIASINLSGGEAAIASEIGNLYKVKFAKFNINTKTKIKEILPNYANISNPLDTTVSVSYDSKTFKRVIDILLDDENVGIIIIGYTLLLNIDDPCMEYMIKALYNVVKERKNNLKPIFIMSYMSNTRNQKYLELLQKIGIIILPSPIYAFNILKELNFV